MVDLKKRTVRVDSMLFGEPVSVALVFSFFALKECLLNNARSATRSDVPKRFHFHREQIWMQSAWLNMCKKVGLKPWVKLGSSPGYTHTAPWRAQWPD